MGGGGSMGMNKVRFVKLEVTCLHLGCAAVHMLWFQSFNNNKMLTAPLCLRLFMYLLATINIGWNGRRVSQRIDWFVCAIVVALYSKERATPFCCPIESVHITLHYDMLNCWLTTHSWYTLNMSWPSPTMKQYYYYTGAWAAQKWEAPVEEWEAPVEEWEWKEGESTLKQSYVLFYNIVKV